MVYYDLRLINRGINQNDRPLSLRTNARLYI